MTTTAPAIALDPTVPATSSVPSPGRRAKRGIAVAVLAATASAALVATGPAAQAAQGSACFQQTLNRTAYATTGFIRRPILDTSMTLKWCSRAGRINGFEVLNYRAVVRDGLLLQPGSETSDIRPLNGNGLGGDRLYLGAKFAAKPTVGGLKYFGFGERTVRYNIQLHHNGVLTGSVWG